MDKSFILFDLQPSNSDDMQQVSACEDIQALSAESDCILVPQFLSDVQPASKNRRTRHANCLTRKSEIAIHSQHCDMSVDVETVKNVASSLSISATSADASKTPKRARRRRKASQDNSMAMPLLMGLEIDETSLVTPTETAAIDHTSSEILQSSIEHESAVPQTLGKLPASAVAQVSAKQPTLTESSALANNTVVAPVEYTENQEQNSELSDKILSSENSAVSEQPSAFDDAQNILMPQKQSEYEQLLKAKALANARLADELNVQPEEVYNPLDYCAELLAGIDVNWEHDEPNLNKLQDVDKSIAMQASQVVSTQYAHSGYKQPQGADYQVVTLVKPSAQGLGKIEPNEQQLIAKRNSDSTSEALSTNKVLYDSQAIAINKELSANDTPSTNKALSDSNAESTKQNLSGTVALDSALSIKSSVEGVSKSADLSSSFFMSSCSLEDVMFKQIASELVHHRTQEEMVQILSELFQAQNFMTLTCTSEHGQAEVDLLAAGGVFGLGGPRICIKLNYDEKPLKRSVVKDFQKLVAKYQADYGILISMHMFKHKVKPVISSEFAKIEFWDMRKAVSEITSHYSSFSAHIHSLLPLERSWVLER